MLRFYSSLNSTHIRCSTIQQLGEVTDSASSTNSAWTTMGVYSSVRISVIMEPDGFSLSSRKYRTALAENHLFKRLHGLTPLCSALSNSCQELLEVDLAGCFWFFDLCENQIDVCGGALLVYDFTILCKFRENFSIHLSTNCELCENFLEATGRGSLSRLSCCSRLGFLRFGFALFGI